MLSYLLENGADPTIKDKTGRDALDIAQYFQRGGVVKILQECKVEKRKQNVEPKDSETIRNISSLNFIEINFLDEFVQCQDGKVSIHRMLNTLCPSLKQHSPLDYNTVTFQKN
jgi:hypothetical protein